MSGHVNEIGSFEAKTRLAELLRRAEQGESFVIHRRGRPVARLIPFESDEARPTFGELAAAFRSVRTGIEGPVNVDELVDDGRRF